ncbi:MAG: hypothetical protein RBQ87_01310 [Candidatus Cloacimonadaceae bacterium]|nr:hypothetical protein [Candidatus Cloacimonadaceae bacterium]
MESTLINLSTSCPFNLAGVDSEYFVAGINNHIFNQIPFMPPDTYWCGLLFWPYDSGDNTKQKAISSQSINWSLVKNAEPGYGEKGYKRVPIYSWATTGARAITNASPIVFPTATADWGHVIGIVLYDAPVGGNAIWWQSFTIFLDGKDVHAGQTVTVPAEKLEAEWSYVERNGVAVRGGSNYLSDKLRRWLFLGESFAPPDLYFAVSSTQIDIDSIGSDLTEPAVDGYFRWRVYPHASLESPRFSSFDPAITGARKISIEAPDSFIPETDEDWGLMWTAVVDSETPGTGNILFFANYNTVLIEYPLPIEAYTSENGKTINLTNSFIGLSVV